MSQETRIEDTFGEKIGGSRRDIRRMFDSGNFSLEGLDEKDLHEAKKLATKDRMWPEPDWASLDTDPRKSMRVRMLRSALPGKCPTVISFEEYIKLVRLTKEKCEAYMASDADPIEGWQDETITDYRTIRFLSTINRKEILFILNPSRASYFDALAEVSGWPAKTDSLLFDGYQPVRVRRSDGGFGWAAGKNGSCVSRRTFDSTDATVKYINDELRNELETKKSSKTSKRVGPVRPMLEGIKRAGPDWGSEDISPEKFQETFNFRGGEFGTWLTQEDRKQSLRYAYDALMDMSHVLGIEPKDIGDGMLGFAFGARGVGKAAAHFESALTVINLTKMNGAGATAHEWGHFIDYTRRPGFKASDHMTWLKELENTPERKEQACQERVRKIVKTLGSWVKQSNQGAMKNMDLLVSTDDFRSDLFETRYRAILHAVVPAKHQRSFVYALSSVKNPQYGNRSEPQFAKDAAKLDIGRSKKYWSTEVELFARVFEKYIDVRMKEEGMENNYLVTLLKHPAFEVYPSDAEMEAYRPHVEAFLNERFPSRQKQDLQQMPVM